MAYSVITTPVTGTPISTTDFGIKVKDNFDAAFPLGVGAWTAFTPTVANITHGSGTVTAVYQRVGRTIFWQYQFVLGAGSAIGTAPTLTLPVVAVGVITGGSAVGVDTGNGPFALILRGVGTSIVGFYRTSGLTATVDGAVTATSPFAWGSGDVLEAAGFYQAAS